MERIEINADILQDGFKTPSQYIQQLLMEDGVSYLIYRLDKQFANEMNVTNFLDAVLNGGLKTLVDQKMGNIAFKFHRHGQEYFWQDHKNIFSEVIKCYI